jgi:GNAT superfamily N-acetyltransferase
MRIEIIEKHNLSQSQLKYINERISLECHKNDIGPCTCWKTYANGLYAAIDMETNEVVALIEASGPNEAINPGWWVDSKCRGKGYGKAVVIELARYLKEQGYYGVGEIRVKTFRQEYDLASNKLKRAFISEFES